MAPEATKSAPHGRRSEIISVRLDPRLKYLAELAARKQRRPLSGFIEWAVERTLNDVILKENHDAAFAESVASAETNYRLWDVDEADRVVRLAMNFPDLTTYEEQLIWKLVRECGYLWRGSYRGPGDSWQWTTDEKSLLHDRLRQTWPTFKRVAAGEIAATELPKWVHTMPRPTPQKPAKPPNVGGAPADDDLPRSEGSIMAKTFVKLSRAAMRKLPVGASITEHGITFERTANGDGLFSVNIMVDRRRIHRAIGRKSEGVSAHDRRGLHRQGASRCAGGPAQSSAAPQGGDDVCGCGGRLHRTVGAGGRQGHRDEAQAAGAAPDAVLRRSPAVADLRLRH